MFRELLASCWILELLDERAPFVFGELAPVFLDQLHRPIMFPTSAARWSRRAFQLQHARGQADASEKNQRQDLASFRRFEQRANGPLYMDLKRMAPCWLPKLRLESDEL